MIDGALLHGLVLLIRDLLRKPKWNTDGERVQ